MGTTALRRSLALLSCLACVVMLAGCLPDAATEGTAPEVVTSTPLPETAPVGEGVPLDQITIGLEPVLDGFEQPLYVTGAGDGSGQLFVLEKTGRVWVVADGERAGVFLALSEKVSTESEQGLLGMAFSPGFAEDGLVFVSYTELDGSSVLSRFTVTGDAVDPASEKKLLRVNHPYANHNGGMIAFALTATSTTGSVTAAARATRGSATWARMPGKRSTSSPRIRRVARTTGGTSSKARIRIPMSRRNPISQASRCRSSSTVVTREPRSPAATCTTA